MSFLRDSGGAMLLQLLAAGLQFVAAVLVARGLAPEGRGIYGLVVLIPEMTRAIAHLGFGTATTRQTVKEPDRSATLAANATLLGICTCVIFCGVLLSFSTHLLHFVQAKGWEGVPAAQGGLATTVFWGILGLPLLLFEGYLNGLLTASRAILTANAAKALQAGSFCLLVPLLFHSSGPTVHSAILAWVFSFALGDLVMAVALLPRLSGPFLPDFPLMRRTFVFGLKTFPASVAVYLLFRVDVALVRAWRTAAEVGLYTNAASLAMVFQILGFATERALVPRLMSRTAEEADQITPLATRSFLLVGFPLAALAIVGAWFVVPLIFGEPYRPSVLPFAILLPGLVIGNVGQICNTDLLGRGYPGYASISATAALLVNLLLNVLLIPRLGIQGAAIASLVCYSQHGIMLAAIHSHLTGVPLRKILLPGPHDALELYWLVFRRR